MKLLNLISLFLVLSTTIVLGQEKKQDKPKSYLEIPWKQVATKMADEWYATDEAKQVAENILICQKDIGGWEKNKPYNRVFTPEEIAKIKAEHSEIGATFDNNATTLEMIFLAKIYTHIKDERYKQAFYKALEYIFVAQYANGGWPQFYPPRADKGGSYSDHITYNDNAMVNTLKLLRDIVAQNPEFKALKISDEKLEKAKTAFDKGIDCILKTQIIVDGKPTIWCAQHDEITLAPAKARKYELPSFSGGESAGITILLMEIKKPTPEIVAAVNGAVAWFESNKILGMRLERQNAKGEKDHFLVADSTAEPIWARFYDLETGKPFFCDRNGIKKATLPEIGDERRNGYAWYTEDGNKVLKKYTKWKNANSPKNK